MDIFKGAAELIKDLIDDNDNEIFYGKPIAVLEAQVVMFT